MDHGAFLLYRDRQHSPINVKDLSRVLYIHYIYMYIVGLSSIILLRKYFGSAVFLCGLYAYSFLYILFSYNNKTSISDFFFAFVSECEAYVTFWLLNFSTNNTGFSSRRDRWRQLRILLSGTSEKKLSRHPN